MNTKNGQITIEMAVGGFIITYPIASTVPGEQLYAKEVFASQRKLLQKIKDLIADQGLVVEQN